MSDSVSFNQIPANFRVPLLQMEFDNSQAGGGTVDWRTLIIGLTSIAQPAVPVFVPSASAASTLFGARSMLAAQVAAYLANDPDEGCWVLPLAPPGGATVAAAAVTITGTATAPGVLPLYVAGTPLLVPIATGDTATNIAINTYNALPAAPPSFSAVRTGAVPTTGAVALASSFKGAVANGLDIRLGFNGEVLPPGITVAITDFSGGTLDPVLTGIDALIGDEEFHFVVNPWPDTVSLGAMTVLMNNATGRWAPARRNYGHVWSAYVDGSSTITTAMTNILALGAALNDPHLTVFGTYNTPTPCWVWGAAHAGAAAVSLRADAATPLQTLQVEGVLAPPVGSRFTRVMEQVLLSTGIACSRSDNAGNVSILREVTTYQTNAAGVPDSSYLDATTLYTLAAISEQLANALGTKFARCKLADNGTPFGSGQNVVTPNTIRAEIVAQYAQMERTGLVENAAAMTAATVVTRNANDNTRVDILWAPYLISGLRGIAIKNQFRLAAALAA